MSIVGRLRLVARVAIDGRRRFNHEGGLPGVLESKAPGIETAAYLVHRFRASRRVDATDVDVRGAVLSVRLGLGALASPRPIPPISRSACPAAPSGGPGALVQQRGLGELDEGLGGAAGVEPVADVALRREARQAQDGGRHVAAAEGCDDGCGVLSPASSLSGMATTRTWRRASA